MFFPLVLQKTAFLNVRKSGRDSSWIFHLFTFEIFFLKQIFQGAKPWVFFLAIRGRSQENVIRALFWKRNRRGMIHTLGSSKNKQVVPWAVQMIKQTSYRFLLCITRQFPRQQSFFCPQFSPQTLHPLRGADTSCWYATVLPTILWAILEVPVLPSSQSCATASCSCACTC